MQDYIIINEKDNVAVALNDLKAGSTIVSGNKSVIVKENIARGHKVALETLPCGASVIKYGNPIGHTICDVKEGCHIHTQNIKTNLGELLHYEYHPKQEKEHTKNQMSSQTVKQTTQKIEYFDGFRRPDGKVGVRNEIWIIPTVGCVNSIATAIANTGKKHCFGSVEDVVAFPHPYGCSQMGDDQEHTRTILSDLILHPNAGGVLVLGLGCENSNISVLTKYLGNYDKNRIRFLQCQDVEDELDTAEKLVTELISYASGFQREPIPASELIIGLKCGGSDGLSGITANPTVGAFSDLLIAQGGTTILTEVPEMFGAETLLMDRCATEDVFQKTVAMINDFKQYFMQHGQTIYENPSPGNKKGGISTLEDKSLGCTQKSGTAPVEAVLSYGECVHKKGLNLLSAPGNDLVASTALAAAGAHIILFTTGRGTPFASPVPTVKISTNSTLANKKERWIDFNCGVLTENTKLSELSEAMFQYVLSVASGKKVKAEEAGFHDMAIFKQGVTL